MRSIAIVAGKEMRDSLRNWRVVAATLLLAALALTMALLGSAPTGTVGVSSLAVTIVSLSSLTVFLMPLIALLIAHDAIAGEVDRGTMALLLAYPVSRSQVVAGKFLGHSVVLAVAAVTGYGAAAAVLALGSGAAEPGAWAAFAIMVGSSVLLGMAFVALGYLVSAAVGDPRTAASIAIGLWLFFALLFDMALLGALVADQGRIITRGAMGALLLANPTDVFRLINLTSGPEVRLYAGMAGAAEQATVDGRILFGSLVGWTVVPLVLTCLVFMRREL